jgi:hypothetical protein
LAWRNAGKAETGRSSEGKEESEKEEREAKKPSNERMKGTGTRNTRRGWIWDEDKVSESKEKNRPKKCLRAARRKGAETAEGQGE